MLTIEDKMFLSRWQYEVRESSLMEDTARLEKSKGIISGYLNALAIRDEITVIQAKELYRFYTH
jgi:hypothetical protein